MCFGDSPRTDSLTTPQRRSGAGGGAWLKFLSLLVFCVCFSLLRRKGKGLIESKAELPRLRTSITIFNEGGGTEGVEASTC